MNNLIDSITQASTTIQAILFVIIFSSLWNIENIIGFSRSGFRKWRHLLKNSVFALTAIPVQFVLGLAFAWATKWTFEHQHGLVYWLPKDTSNWIVFIVSLMLLDLSEYFYHRQMHRFKNLWRVHMVHHSDHVVDVSTVLREHPAETAVRLLNTLVWTFLLGIPVWCLVFRQILQVVFTVASHVNARLPDRTDRIVSLVFITPNMHQVHHHFQLPYTDRNFGDILSIWDRLFGTFARMDFQDLVFGVDTCPIKVENASGLELLALPFYASKD
ncbi:MAG: sterol desaturase family protein [Saprospiraceae bacterium]